MMRDIWFVLKMLVITAIVVLLLQIHVGSRTVESRAYSFLQSSPVSYYVQKVATGAVKLSSDSYHKAIGMLSRHNAQSSLVGRAVSRRHK